MTVLWTETKLPTSCSKYKLNDIFNADEFGLFYQCLPKKTNYLLGDKYSKYKNSKVSHTEMAIASVTGGK